MSTSMTPYQVRVIKVAQFKQTYSLDQDALKKTITSLDDKVSSLKADLQSLTGKVDIQTSNELNDLQSAIRNLHDHLSKYFLSNEFS